MLWHCLRDRSIDGWKFKRQVPRGPYIVDFVCLERNLVVEVDGSQHYDKRAAHDQARTKFLESQGMQVIRFTNEEVLARIGYVLEAIYQALGARPCPSPRPSPQQGEGEEDLDADSIACG